MNVWEQLEDGAQESRTYGASVEAEHSQIVELAKKIRGVDNDGNDDFDPIEDFDES